ncbi:MAG: flagellar hook-basal body complex protein FliE [bacterium]
MAEQINPISNSELRLAQLLGDDYLAQVSPVMPTAAPAPVEGIGLSANIFDDVLNKAIEAMNGVSETERYANQMVERYLQGEAELHEVMIAQSKMSIVVQLAVTTITSAVTTFKEITQMQI